MARPHFIEAVAIHPSFNDILKPWGPQRLRSVVPSCVAVFKPAGGGIPTLTSQDLRKAFGVRIFTIVCDRLYNIAIVFLSSRNAVRAVIRTADKLPDYDISVLTEDYELCAHVSSRIVDWIAEQALPGPLDDATILAANALASPFVPLEAGELDGLEAFSDGELNDIVPDLEHESISDGEDDGDLAVAFEPSPTAEPVRSSTDNYYQNYNAHILSILLALIHTGPNEMWSSSWLLPFLDQDRPLLTEGYDVTLEGALWRAVEEAEKIQENTGDTSLLDGTYDAMIMVWDTLELGELPDGVQ